jgi:hypothetical protein
MDTIDHKFDKERKNQYLPPDFTPLNAQLFDKEVWEPHFWFFFHTIAHSYPSVPNSTTKRKYYDFIINIPLFIPNPEVGNEFSKLLDKYPVSPYLDSRDSFIRWMHFFHNKRNKMLGKEEISLFSSLDNYRNFYKPQQIKLSEQFHLKKEYIVMVFTILVVIAIYFFYK